MVSQQFREHLGASKLGHECGRALWYDFRWSLNKVISARMRRLFMRGHIEEVVVISDLIEAGCKIKFAHIDGAVREIFKIAFGLDFPESKQKHGTFAFGFGGGSCDGVITNLPGDPNTKHLLEVKTSNTGKFIKMKAEGVKKANQVHYSQMQIYMKLFKLNKALYIMSCKETDERYYEIIEYDAKLAKKLLKKAETIILSPAPPPKINNDPGFYLCRWCDSRMICHSKKSPDRNCRTCDNVIFASENNISTVRCKANNGKELKFKKQIKGCSKYTVDKVYG